MRSYSLVLYSSSFGCVPGVLETVDLLLVPKLRFGNALFGAILLRGGRLGMCAPLTKPPSAKRSFPVASHSQTLSLGTSQNKTHPRRLPSRPEMAVKVMVEIGGKIDRKIVCHPVKLLKNFKECGRLIVHLFDANDRP